MNFQSIKPPKWTYRPSRQFSLFTERNGLRHERNTNESPFSFWGVLRMIWYLLKRLFVAVKFQALRYLPTHIRLPWFKLAVVGFLVYLIFQRDLQFQVRMNSPVQSMEESRQTVQNAGSTLSLSNSLLGEDIAPKPAPKIDPFAAIPGDTDRDKKIKSYIRRFQQVAIAEMAKFNIPASIKMGQAIIESDAGQSRLARDIDNHFGMKCFSRSCKENHCTNFPDDHHKDFFLRFESSWASWRAHSELLVGDKYKHLLKHGMDYKAWANGLKEIGYATDPKYPEKLIRTIEKYQLYTMDQ